MEEINIKLKSIRKARGLTQAEIARKLGITQSAYCQIENGDTSTMKVATLYKVCKELDLSADDLLGIKPMRFETPKVGEQVDIRKQATKAVSKAIRNSRKQYTLKQFGMKRIKKET